MKRLCPCEEALLKDIPWVNGNQISRFQLGPYW